MFLKQRYLSTLAALTLAAPLHAAPPELVFLAPTNHTMPIAAFNKDALSDGILKDVGEAIAQRMGRSARFISAPSKRVGSMLTQGQADGICYLLRDWIEGDFHWTAPMIPNGAILVARADAPVVRKLSELRNVPLGTVLGYRYLEIDEALGATFRRDDAPSMIHNIRKLNAGRTQYAVLEQASLVYQQRLDPTLKFRTDLVVRGFKAGCAFSLKSKVPFPEVERAVNALIHDGGMDAIMARYR